MTPKTRIQSGTPAGGQFAPRMRVGDLITLHDDPTHRDWFGADPAHDDPTVDVVMENALGVNLTDLLFRFEAGEIDRGRAAAEFWMQKASGWGVRGVFVRSISWESARTASLAVNTPELGGAWGIASRYLRSGIRTAEVEALALPFSNFGTPVPDSALARIAKVLTERPSIANALWDAVLDYATLEL